jgi:hypothetical protein
MRNLGLLIVSLFLVAACSNKPCHEVNTDGIPENILKSQGPSKVSIYKYDGTKQCGQGQEISLDAMSKQLRDIKIISMTKKHDGQMRIQVCGAATGYANVYEISEKDLKKAKTYGFQLWGF